MSAMRTLAATVAAFAAGLAVTWTATNGLSAFTLETARREAALAHPTPIPALPLRFVDGRVGPLGDVPARWLLVDFIYTRCDSLCLVQGSIDHRLAEMLAPEIAQGHVSLVSISFDPRDDRAALRTFLGRDGPALPGREAAVPVDARDLPRWLGAFGVVVIDDGIGGYVHNDAVAIVDPGRRMVELVDSKDPAAIAAAVRARW
jgi:protein SCO1/2